jgi:hypothetical protein
MTVPLDPLIFEFETEEEAVRYDAWFRTKVEQALTSVAPRFPHDDAVARVEALLAAKRAARVDRTME